MRSGDHELHGRTIGVSHPDRVMFPDAGITKGDLLEYHDRIGGTMLPHVRGRPVALKRYPEGIGEKGFFQKRAPKHLPDWVRRVDVPTRDEPLPHVVVDEVATVLALVQYGTVELHPWTALADDLRRPDRIVMDLDPEEGDLDGARLATRAVRDVFDEIGLEPHVMTSGSKGYHVVVAIEPEPYEVVGRLAKDVARVVERRQPDATTLEYKKADRAGRVYLDWVRNNYGQTSVVPYGVRARPGAPVATPLDWDELGSVAPGDHTVRNLFRRLGQREDPWADMPVGSVASARDPLDALLAEVDLQPSS